MLRQEMNLGYFDMIHRPAEKLGVFDNGSDFEECATRTHCNCTHDTLAPGVVWNEERHAYELDETGLPERLKRFGDTIQGRRHAILTGGEHNNVYFPGFYQYRERLPQALMQSPDGSWLELRDPDILQGKPIPMPAIDDPDLTRLYKEQLARQAAQVKGCHHVAAHVMGFEMLYPEYFGLGNGDYRPVSWQHFKAWCELLGEAQPAKEETLQEGSRGRALWLRFREQAMADRAMGYYQAILNEDDTHLCFYPTHGSTLHGQARAQLSQQPDSLAAACDGIEMGHILIDDDAERRNVIMTCLNTSYGTPVIVPRLGNKTPDLGAAGGGRSFTPETLRRLVYEDVGMGISVIFPIHWRSHLHDGEWFIKNTPAEAECRRVFDELIEAAPFMTGMGRMQPALGVLAGDERWLQGWNMRWTACMQDLIARHVNATLITDRLIEPDLSRRMPLLLVMDQPDLGEETQARLLSYMDGGGRVLCWGGVPEKLKHHPGLLESHAALQPGRRVIREMFLTGMREGTCSTRYQVQPVDVDEVLDELQAMAPDALLYPFLVEDGGRVNVYPLTDRGGMGCVCINMGDQEESIAITPNPLAMHACSMTDMLTGQPFSGRVTLPPHGTRMVYFSAAGREDADIEERICRAEDAYELWKRMGAEVGALRHFYAGMRSGFHRQKRDALARAMLQSLALRCSVRQTDAGWVIRADVYDARGEAVKDAHVSLRVVPGPYRHLPMRWNGECYECALGGDDLPMIYDADTQRYVPLHGAARLILQAENDTCQGGCLCTARL